MSFIVSSTQFILSVSFFVHALQPRSQLLSFILTVVCSEESHVCILITNLCLYFWKFLLYPLASYFLSIFFSLQPHALRPGKELRFCSSCHSFPDTGGQWATFLLSKSCSQSMHMFALTPLSRFPQEGQRCLSRYLHRLWTLIREPCFLSAAVSRLVLTQKAGISASLKVP